MASKSYLWIIIFALIFAAGVTGGYLYFSRKDSSYQKENVPVEKAAGANEDKSTLRIYYPSNNRLEIEERRVQRRPTQKATTESVISEFLKGPANAKASVIPNDTKLLDVYKGTDGIFYLNFSDELKRNFQGDALSEFMLLKGLYESVMSNVSGITDLKILIEGKEVESLGEHIYLLCPLGEIVSQAAEVGD